MLYSMPGIEKGNIDSPWMTMYQIRRDQIGAPWTVGPTSCGNERTKRDKEQILKNKYGLPRLSFQTIVTFKLDPIVGVFQKREQNQSQQHEKLLDQPS